MFLTIRSHSFHKKDDYILISTLNLINYNIFHIHNLPSIHISISFLIHLNTLIILIIHLLIKSLQKNLNSLYLLHIRMVFVTFTIPHYVILHLYLLPFIFNNTLYFFIIFFFKDQLNIK